jgi:Bacterial archaeo-eukaryotic release factor family 10
MAFRGRQEGSAAMITHAEVEKLLGVCSADASVLSLYLSVPVDPPALRGLPARADELLAAPRLAAAQDRDAGQARDEARRTVRRMLEIHAREWLGHTVAIFACSEPRLAEAFVLPGTFEERAVFAVRPHVRPLLVARQRFPDYCAVVADREHAWAFRIMGERIDGLTFPAGAGVRSTRFGGWYGLEAHRMNQRVIQLARHHYRDTAASLDSVTRASDALPLVIGGHPHDIPQFLDALTDEMREQVVGEFAVDPHTMTPSQVRELAGQIVSRWVSARERRLIAEVLGERPGGLAAVGLQPCLDAVNQHAAKLLVVPENGMISGFACQRCAILSRTGNDCPEWGAASVRVPDLIEEMAVAALRDGAQVAAVSDPPGGIAAQLCYPLAAWHAQSA